MGRYEDTVLLLQSVTSTSAGDPIYLLLQADALSMTNRSKKLFLSFNRLSLREPDFPERRQLLALSRSI